MYPFYHYSAAVGGWYAEPRAGEGMGDHSDGQQAGVLNAPPQTCAVRIYALALSAALVGRDSRQATPSLNLCRRVT
jgi:hypothetical protein